MDKEKLVWRSFADPGPLGQGAIATRWNLAATPTLYVLDHHGVIRHKWVGSPGEKALDAALDQLSKAADANGKNATPRKLPGTDRTALKVMEGGLARQGERGRRGRAAWRPGGRGPPRRSRCGYLLC